MMRFSLANSVSDDDAAAVWPVYQAVFDDQPDYRTWRKAVWDRHSARDGFRLACAHDGEVAVGFAYGYTGDDGQWWTDNARRVLQAQVAQSWLGGHFELVSIGVLEAARGCGIGRKLMHLLLEGLPHDRLLLMTTADAADPARRLYASEGWHVLGAGIADGTVIMGRRGGT